MANFIKKILFIFIFLMWIIYFSNIFSPRGFCVSENTKNRIKNITKNTKHNVFFCNNENDSEFDSTIYTNNFNIINSFHNTILTNSQQKNKYIYKFYPDITIEENEFINLVNHYRFKNNLPSLLLESDLSNIANLKTIDIKETKHLSNTSQTYGSLGDFLNKYDIKYSSCSQIILTNKDIISGFNKLVSSKEHNELLLTNKKIYTGISIIDSTTYGKIIVQIFVEK